MSKSHDELIAFCAHDNEPTFNFNKALEEAAEFMDATLKYQTKHPDNPKRPPKEEILKEYGDLTYRGLILLKMINPELTLDQIYTKIIDHVSMKLDKLQQYRKDGHYANGL